jgi:uncharacterized membrane protein HdeD (DUF308 family)
LFLGIVQVVGGLFALAIPLAASLAAAIVFGVVLLVTGVAQLIHAFSVRGWKGRVRHALGGVLYTAAGLIVLAFPITGVLTLSIILGVLLVADGVVRYALAYRLRPREGWGWFVTAGIASLIVGSLLLLGWPLAGLWAIGILMGVNLLFSGLTNSSLAVALRSREARDPAREPFPHSNRQI